jgi:cystathionine beta-lyase
MPERPIELSVPDLALLAERRSEKWATHDRGVVASSVAEMDFPLAEPITISLVEAVRRHDLGYTPPPPWRVSQCLADFAERRLGWSIDPGQVTLVADVMSGLVELCRLLTRSREPVGFFTPAYPPFFADLLEATSELLQLPLLRDGGYDLAALEDALSRGLRVLIITNPHNPTGRVAEPAELAAIAELCLGHQAWVLSDEIHAPLVLPPATHTPWLEISSAARACGFGLTSASKAFNVAGLKCAMIVTASNESRAIAERLPRGLTDRVGLLGMIAAEAAFTDGDSWLDAVVGQLDRNRSLLSELLPVHLPQLRWRPPQATYLAWLDCEAFGVPDPAAVFLERGRVAVSPGALYGPDSANHVRLNFGTSPELVEEMVRRMSAAVSGPE